VTSYRRFTHGEAVGWGLVGEALIARRRGLLADAAFDAIASAVDHLGPRPRMSDLDADDVLAAISRDKKGRAGKVPFVLPRAIGRVQIRPDIGGPDVRHALKVMASREARVG